MDARAVEPCVLAAELPIVDYDSFGDFLYLRVEEEVDGEAIGDTPEGHAFLCPVGGPEQIVQDIGGNLLGKEIPLAVGSLTT